ncbi:RloB family protein [Aquisphaera insulae]|uniref:RloB family protein n=1 Tax=Aquisphaera insulae TaxID=2712864 RepID=UPI0013EC1DB8|nr:RloB family protein [Aquisphaera insulae]
MNRRLNRRILIVGEGRETEYNYFVGFRNALEEELESTATSVVVKRGKGGSARNIVENAIKKRKEFKPDPDRGDRAFLLLDTEGPGRASELPEANRLAKKNGIDIVYSCPSFEYWLLCHFEKASRSHFRNCASVIEVLDRKWKGVCKFPYDKTDQDVFERLSDRLMLACDQALAIDLHHIHSQNAAVCVNPSTQVFELVAILIGAKTAERCPIAGRWRSAGSSSVTVEFVRGDRLPEHEGRPVRWSKDPEA